MSRELDVNLFQHDLNASFSCLDDGTPSKKMEKFWIFSGNAYLCGEKKEIC